MNLTINEQLMYDTKDANLCIFMANLSTWIKYNSSKLHLPLSERNYHDGRYWSYNSVNDFVKYFGFWSIKNIRTIIKNCIDQGLVITSTFNKKKYDNTLWYSLTDKGLEYFPKVREVFLTTLADSGKTLADSGKPIPEHINAVSNNSITNISESDDSLAPAIQEKKKKQSSVEMMRQLIEVYRQEFPDNPQPHPRVISTTLERTLQTLIKRWHELDPDGNPLTVELFQRYLHMLRLTAPKFSLGEYETQSGRRKKNDLVTFSRWDTVVKFLENKYS